MRTDQQTRDIVDEAVALFRLKGASVASAFLYRFGVPAAVIERVMDRERSLSAIDGGSDARCRPVLISDVLATYRLALREPRLPQGPRQLDNWPPKDQTLHGILESARVATGSDSVGISLFDETLDHLTWIDIVGEFSSYKGHSIPRRNSMCDVCFQTAQSQLFLRPHCYFEWMAAAGLVVNEALVTPIRGGRQFYFGTLWSVTNSRSVMEFTAAHLGMLKIHALAAREALDDSK